MAPKIHHLPDTRKRTDVLDALRAFVAGIVDERLGAQAGRRSARIIDEAISVKQIPTLEAEGVLFSKVGKFWTVDVQSLEAYRARRRTARDSKPANDAVADPLADLPAEVASAIRKAASGGRG